MTVCQVGRPVTTLQRRPVRLMPSGSAGVVYQGAVYPLYTGDIIRLEDDPLDKEACGGFVTGRGRIPYAPAVEPVAEASPVCRIDAWHLESNRFGHYLVFDSSHESAQLLVEIVEQAGLGVKRWDESTRPADNGAFYDWFIRLGFDGTREECLQRLDLLFVAEDAEDSLSNHTENANGADDSIAGGRELADALLAAGIESISREVAVDRLAFFDHDGGYHDGYLAWRFHEMCTRPGQAADYSDVGQLQRMRSIVLDVKELIVRLAGQHGRYLDNRPHLARRALDAELDKVDLDASWRSPDDALRRARASLTFLRHAVILTFGSEDYGERLHPLLHRLLPPPEVPNDDAAPNLAAAVGNLRRMIHSVEELFSRDAAGLAILYEDARAELTALEGNDFDFLADLPDESGEAANAFASEDLPFSILPPGELVQSFVDGMRRSGGYLGKAVDPRRTQVLQELANHFAARRCTVHRGAFSSGYNDNGYVVLRLPIPGSAGEDAVAISPLKGEHATFVVRHGCGAKRPWPTVLSQNKSEAKTLGARRLLFKVNLDRRIKINEYDAMLSKIIALLECEAALFDHGELYFEYERRRYEVREPLEDGGRVANPFAPSPSRPSNVFQRIVSWISP
ncbi:hypothetical protein MTER_34430 [Mycolicibacter terrae]|uniref:Uncharacterized protein n=1 Tax=Mycolicibacter terrae TaxID=1788 RepID=A0AAD1HYK9_9MYCO|nr:hypothetical protein AWC28_11085 [Mycolicibacter terrae]BBX24032.1 hypothetical protein MTER_34430 [Mycolicibacter terrae]